MFNCKLACIVLLFAAILCHTSPVLQASERLDAGNFPSSSSIHHTKANFKYAKDKISKEFQEAGFNSSTDIEELHSKFSHILSKYETNRSISRLAYIQLETLGVSQEKIDLLKYRRTLKRHQEQEKRDKENGIQRRPIRPYKPRRGQLPTLKEGPVSSQSLRNRNAKEMEYKELIERIEQARLGKQTDPMVYLDYEHQLRRGLTALRFGQLLGKYMIETRNDADWYRRFTKSRDRLKQMRYNERKRAGKAQQIANNSLKPSSSLAILSKSIACPTVNCKAGSISASPDESSRKETRHNAEKSTLSIKIDDDDQVLMPLTVKTKANEVDPSLAIVTQRLTRQRSKNRKPRKSYDIFDHKNSSSSGDSGKNVQPLQSILESRPTTGEKRFRGSQAANTSPDIDEVNEGGHSDAFRPIERPTTAKKRFTGVFPFSQTAQLTPKKTTSSAITP